MLNWGVLKKDRAVTERKVNANAKDTGCISDINRVLDAHLYSRRSKGYSVVLTFSAPLELISSCRVAEMLL